MTFLSRSRSLRLPYFNDALFYLVDLQNIQDKEITEAREFLDEEALNRAQRRIFKEAQYRAIIVHAMLRFCLEKLTKQQASKIRILRTAFGKPYLEGFPIHFNLSHTSQYAFLAFHQSSPIGVDIERVQNNPDLLNIADLFMHPIEKQKMNQAKDPYDYFFTLWCAKEAFLKATDIGFNELSHLLVDADTAQGSDFFTLMDHKIYVCRHEVKDHKLAVCQIAK